MLLVSLAGFRKWRQSRPFWGGLFLVLSAVEIFLSTQLSLGGLSFQLGPTGFLSWLIPTILLACGVLSWTTPAQRLFYAVVGAVTAVFSLIGVNLGGFFVGLVLGIVGAGLVFAWLPGTPAMPAAAAEEEDALPDPAPSDPNASPGAAGYAVIAFLLVLGISSLVALRGATPAYAAPCPKSAPGQGTATPSPTAELPAPEKPKGGLLGDIIDGITDIFDGDDEKKPDPGAAPTPSATPNPTPAADAGKPKPGDCAESSRKADAVPLLGPDASVPLVNSKPSVLTGTKLTMWGLRLDGIYVLHTAAGDVRSLKFSMNRSLVRTFALRVPQKAGTPLLIKSNTLTVRGNVAFYTSRFVGQIAGIKLTLTPDSPLPPDGIPLTLPRIDFDDPHIDLMYVSCDELLAPTLDESFIAPSA
ncbi:DUF6114 domain-containing protein [Asanoa sp. NPDC049518]|uniref:DUF6114 domain-containing protein n=1 Tax=unclassified Asanoa TaxID=2685164 RepID=UPI00341E1F7B